MPGKPRVLVKPVAAVPGDLIDIFADGVRINGVPVPHSELAAVDSQSRPVPSVPDGVYPVAPGTVWVISTHDPLSYDFRYFGPVPIANLRGAAFPLLVTK